MTAQTKGVFQSLLKRHNPDSKGRKAIVVVGDQLTDLVGPLSKLKPQETAIVMLENHAEFSRRPYHRQKIALQIGCMRQFALEQARRGVAVEYRVHKGSDAEVIEQLNRTLGPLVAMEPASYEQRAVLAAAVKSKALSYVGNETFLTTDADFGQSQKPNAFRMDAFYQHVRKQTGVLMEKGKPVGGKFSFDVDNRKRWNGSPAAPTPLRFAVDDVMREVGQLVETRFVEHPGTLSLETIASTQAQAQAVWKWAREQCLEHFGPFEDAMSVHSKQLFHTGVSALMNLSRLLPKQLIADAEKSTAPLASREGFIRQILGWREFVRHVHVATDGFRKIDNVSISKSPGDAGYQRWSNTPWSSSALPSADGGAAPNHLEANVPLPPAFWGKPSGLNCLDTVVRDVWADAYGHHITRLMVLSNLATLLGLSPRELTDWFWVAYADAHDWVVEPNVLGMGTYSCGPVMTTKPYVSGAAYINKMSDYCQGCRFDPKKNCPVTQWYWAFLNRHAEGLRRNPRMAVPVSSAMKRSDAQKSADAASLENAVSVLSKGKRLEPKPL